MASARRRTRRRSNPRARRRIICAIIPSSGNAGLMLPIREVNQATPRAKIVRLDLGGHEFSYDAGQAIAISMDGGKRSFYSIASSPEDSRRRHMLELLVGTDASEPPET